MDEETKGAFIKIISDALDEALRKSENLKLAEGERAEIEVNIPEDFMAIPKPPPPPPDNMEVDLLTKKIKITLKG